MKNTRLVLSLWLCLGLLVPLFGGCDADGPSGGRACASDQDCTFGSICLSSSGVCGQANCNFCTGDQICLNVDGAATCSIPQCRAGSECGFGERCEGGLCVQNTCGEDGSCPSGQVCDELADECIAECVDDASCGAGLICELNTKLCRPGCREDEDCRVGERCGEGDVCELFIAESCQDVRCEEGEFCDPLTLDCQLKCVDEPDQPSSCGPGERCDAASFKCTSINCPGQTSAQCDGDEQTPYWRDDLCRCVECQRDTDCETGQVCDQGTGQCQACDSPCDAGTPGSCGGTTPYCVDTCCVACLADEDCPVDKACVEGRCADRFACDDSEEDPCPDGFVCEDAECVPGEQDLACSAGSADACSAGQFCNPFTGSCEDLGGGECGLCNSDCTCGGGLICDGGLCTGCSVPFDPACSSNMCTMFDEGRFCRP